tara:strand:+ start:17679 stop:18104 length:426 start_codon:yes stop_codon:yes gene_type:complete
MTDEEKKKLELFNIQVGHAIERRKLFLDSLMEKYAKVKIGEDIYDLHTGKLLGVVKGYYRYWEDRDDGVRDNFLAIDYLYTSPHSKILDNTSNKLVWVGTHAQLIEKMERDVERQKWREENKEVLGKITKMMVDGFREKHS